MSTADPGSNRSRPSSHVPWGVLGAHAAAWIVAAGFEFWMEGEVDFALVLLGLLSLVIVWFGYRVTEEKRWIRPLRALSASVHRLKENPEGNFDSVELPDFDDISRALRDLQRRLILVNRQARGSTPPRPILEDSSEFTKGDASTPPSAAVPAVSAPPRVLDTPLDLVVPPQVESDIACRLDPRTLRRLDSTEAEQRLLGRTFDELRAHGYEESILEEDRETAVRLIRAAVAAGDALGLRWRVVDACGEPHPLLVNLSMRYDHDGTPRYLKLQAFDETERVREDDERKRREQELTWLNRQLKSINAELLELTRTNEELYENAPVMYFSLDRRLSFIDCNKMLLERLGIDREQLIGKAYGNFLVSREAEQSRVFFRRLSEDGSAETEATWRKPDGTEMTVWMAVNVVLKRDGSFAYARAVARDETERRKLQAELASKNAVLERTNEELSRRNKELDEFSHIVSHDLLEPVRSLIAFSEYLQNDFGPKLDDNGREYLQHLVEAARRQRSFIRDLLTLSRAGRVVTKFQAVDLADVIRAVRVDLAGLIRERHAEITVEGELPPVWGDRGRIQQLLANLIVNGIKYNRRETPRIDLSSETLPEGQVLIRVSDNGIGIPPHAHDRAFELFRQLHPRGEFEGTGAGLAICRKIAQAHGGEIRIERSVEGPDGGTTFAVILPAVLEKTAVTIS